MQSSILKYQHEKTVFEYLLKLSTSNSALQIIRQLNAWICPRLHDIMRECFTRDLWEMRQFEFLRVATFI